MKMEVADLTNKDVMKPSDAEEENLLIPMTSDQMEAEMNHQYFSKYGSFYSPGGIWEGQSVHKTLSYLVQVSELLESGKSMLKELSNEFEERLLQIHKEQMEKWQEEVKELDVLDTANEEADVLLLNAKNLLQNVHGEFPEPVP